jgi:arsenate reductase
VGNSARSQIAEALVNARLEAFSAGTQPAARVNPNALAVLAEIGIQTMGSHPKHLSIFYGQRFDAIVTVCDDAAENCPTWAEQGIRFHVGFSDPAEVVGDTETVLTAFRETREAIIARMLPVLKAISA